MTGRAFNRRALQFEPLEDRRVLYSGTNPTATLVTNFGDIPFELLPDVAPGTVENFLNYIQDGDYTDSIFHRLVPNFVLQGGGFNTTKELFCPPVDCSLDVVDSYAFDEVPTDPPIVNEFNLSNVRGTVAMAKLGNAPDSATNQFFVNLSDNSGNLDNQNGGFTVFARVTDMTVVDQIAQLSVADLSGIFEADQSTALRAISAAPFESRDDGYHLVQVQSIEVTGAISGRIFLDSNDDGVYATTEPVRGGLTVFDDANENGDLDAGEASTVTDNDGSYVFRFDQDHTYHLRILDGENWSATSDAMLSGTITPGNATGSLNFGTQLSVASWHNTALAEDVDGINGVTPLDALQIINEINARTISNPETGALPAAPDGLDLYFPDTNDDLVVSPLDAIIVINRLNDTSASSNAALASVSSSRSVSGTQTLAQSHATDDDEDEDEPVASPVTQLFDHVFAAWGG